MSQARWELYGTPYFPAQVGLALSVGWILGGTLQHRSVVWVWIFPFLALFSAFFGFPLAEGPSSAFILYPQYDHLSIAQSASLDFSHRLGHFFGRGNGIQPFDQVIATLPFYSAAAYSMGGLLARSVVAMPKFFETMRHLRKKRLIFFVCIPWFCLKLISNWQQATSQNPVLRTWVGLRFYLQGLLIASVFVTFVLAIAVSLVGRRVFLTRFFLNPGESPRD